MGRGDRTARRGRRLLITARLPTGDHTGKAARHASERKPGARGTEGVMTNPVAWFEMLGGDAAALQRFYRELFGWQIDADNPMNYGMVPAAEGGIGGGIGPSQDGSPQLTVYVQVTDLHAALDRAAQLGGKILSGPMEVPGGPTLAYFA